MKRMRLIVPALLFPMLVGGVAQVPVTAQEIVQPPTPHADELADQMRILGSDPKNLEALIAAGRLSARLGEPAAALQFFQRAEDVSPSDPRIIAGRASAYVVLGRPGEALRLFAEAEQKGVPVSDFAADRGLAYDLTGHPDYAQADYRLALSRGQDDEVVRRLALSLAISGERKDAEKLLDDMLRKQDRGAWRAQAFNLAINGDISGAEKIARTILPNFGSNLKPFFKRLEDASRAEQAFAVHFGQLSLGPMQIADAKLAPPLPSKAGGREEVRLASVDTRRSDGKHHRDRKSRHDRNADRVATIQTPIPVRLTQADPKTESDPGNGGVHLASTALQPVEPPPPPTKPAKSPAAATAGVAGSPDGAAMVSQPGSTAAAETTPSPTKPSAIGAEESQIAAIMKGITVPDSERDTGAAVGGETPKPAFGSTIVRAPDKIAPAKIAPKPSAAAKAEAKVAAKPKSKKAAPDPAKLYPERHWVQVAGGANKDTLPREWKRLKGEAPDAFKGQQAWTTPLRFTNRLLAGPFDSDGDAQDFVNKLAGKGLSAFTFNSDAGQKIEKLDTP